MSPIPCRVGIPAFHIAKSAIGHQRVEPRSHHLGPSRGGLAGNLLMMGSRPGGASGPRQEDPPSPPHGQHVDICHRGERPLSGRPKSPSVRTVPRRHSGTSAATTQLSPPLLCNGHQGTGCGVPGAGGSNTSWSAGAVTHHPVPWLTRPVRRVRPHRDGGGLRVAAVLLSPVHSPKRPQGTAGTPARPVTPSTAPRNTRDPLRVL